MNTKNELERLVDAHSLGRVLESLAEICHEKADHLVHDWQDHTTASVWTKTAKQIERLRSKVIL